MLVEPWMQHYREQLRQLASGEARTVEMRGHVYGLCKRCRKVVKLTGWFSGLHMCA
jgi:hypothetical protein